MNLGLSFHSTIQHSRSWYYGWQLRPFLFRLFSSHRVSARWIRAPSAFGWSLVQA